MPIQSLHPLTALLLALTLLLSACNSEPASDEQESAVKIRPAKLIKVGRAESTDSTLLRYPAVIQSRQLSMLAFAVSGMVEKLNVVEAQRVRQGDILAQLDQQDFLTSLNSAQTQYDNAEKEYQRALRLIKKEAISRSILEQRQSQRDISKNQLDSVDKAMKDTVLVAPFDGHIAKVSIEERQIVQVGETAISVLGDGGLEAKINLPASIIANAQKRNETIIGSYIILAAAADRRIPATFKAASLEADASSQTYEVVFSFEAPDDLIILPGMNAIVWLEDPSQAVATSDQINVPLTAIATENDQHYVWVFDEESMMVSKRNITIEEDVGANLTVIDGLEAGETIVATGISYLSEGMRVRPWSH